MIFVFDCHSWFTIFTRVQILYLFPRFEAEISGEQRMRPVIASSTYGVQQKLQGSGSSSSGPLLPTPNSSFSMGNIPPPPAPPSLLMPTQLQRPRLAPPPSFPGFPGFMPLSPPKPQPAVLSGAPQIYRSRDRSRVSFHFILFILYIQFD